MTIQSIIRNRKGRAHAWRVESNGESHQLWHYSTLMLEWADLPDGVQLRDAGLGHGSVSDQNGMNIAFRELGLPFYYSRAGGAGIVSTERA